MSTRTDTPEELLARSIVALTTVMMRVENAIGFLAASIMVLVAVLVLHWEGVL